MTRGAVAGTMYRRAGGTQPLEGVEMGTDVHQKRAMADADDPNPMARRELPSLFQKLLWGRKARILDWRKRKALKRRRDATTLQHRPSQGT